MLRSVTIPFKNLIQYLSLNPLTPTEPPSYQSDSSRILTSSPIPSRTHSSVNTNPSSLVPSSTRSSVKTPDTYQDPYHPLCHTNDITALDPDFDPDLWLILAYSLISDSLTHPYYSYAYWCSFSMLTDDPVAYWCSLSSLIDWLLIPYLCSVIALT
jgi:hypothetical protein